MKTTTHTDPDEHVWQRPRSSRGDRETRAAGVTSSSRPETKPWQVAQHTSSFLAAALEDERARIAREIHDQLGQSLIALKLDLALLMQEERDCGPKLAALMTDVEATISAMREVVSGLRPRIVEDFGLIAAVGCDLDKFRSRTGISCTYSTTEEALDLNREQSIALYRIFQEALTNVARHAQASHVAVTLKKHDESVLLEVLDDGVGIALAEGRDRRSLGLLNMHERASALGGDSRVFPRSGGGTTVSVRIPIRQPESSPCLERRRGSERRKTETVSNIETA